MAVVVINKLPCFLSLPYCKLFLSRQQHQVEDYRLGCKIQENPSQKTSTIRACSIKSSKRSRLNSLLCFPFLGVDLTYSHD
uniref:Uncharacterized protein n=1 Tax=Rhizophora mucronata TaxID=61149 RepID=A0A2P2KJ45_RHIMU